MTRLPDYQCYGAINRRRYTAWAGTVSTTEATRTLTWPSRSRPIHRHKGRLFADTDRRAGQLVISRMPVIACRLPRKAGLYQQIEGDFLWLLYVMYAVRGIRPVIMSVTPTTRPSGCSIQICSGCGRWSMAIPCGSEYVRGACGPDWSRSRSRRIFR